MHSPGYQLEALPESKQRVIFKAIPLKLFSSQTLVRNSFQQFLCIRVLLPGESFASIVVKFTASSRRDLRTGTVRRELETTPTPG